MSLNRELTEEEKERKKAQRAARRKKQREMKAKPVTRKSADQGHGSSMEGRIKARSQYNRAARQDQLREMLQGRSYIRQLRGIHSELIELGESAKNLKLAEASSEKPFPRDAFNSEMEKLEMRRKLLKDRTDLNFKKLAKVLPDLKQVEITDPDGNTFETFASAVIALREGVNSEG